MAEADGGGCAFQQASSGVFILMPGSTMPPRFPISVPPYRSAKAGGNGRPFGGQSASAGGSRRKTWPSHARRTSRRTEELRLAVRSWKHSSKAVAGSVVDDWLTVRASTSCPAVSSRTILKESSPHSLIWTGTNDQTFQSVDGGMRHQIGEDEMVLAAIDVEVATLRDRNDVLSGAWWSGSR
jgi:hypothetical protein